VDVSPCFLALFLKTRGASLENIIKRILLQMKILYNECITNSLGGFQMQEQLHSNMPLPQIQRLLGQILEEVKGLYDKFIPIDIRQRWNIDLQKQQDVVIISVCVLGKMFEFTSERAWHAFAEANLFCGQPLSILFLNHYPSWSVLNASRLKHCFLD
jgi:hypothetical protein